MYQRMSLKEFKSYMAQYRHSFEKLYRFNHKEERGEWIRYHRCFCGFDIETTQKDDKGYMYIWQFGYLTDSGEQKVIKGRKWSEFIELIGFLRKRLSLRTNTRLIIWVANLSFEYQFMKHYLGNPDEVFAKTPRNPLLVRYGGIEFREALSISQGGLEYLAKTWTKTQKLVGDLDYSIPRVSTSKLSEQEECYCDNDVIILSEFSKKIFDEYIRVERYIPMTSTGILRHNLRRKAKESVDKAEKVYHWIKGLFPRTKADYLFIMEKLFRGGYVHSCFTKTDQILVNQESFDRKSSYPASGFQDYYPVTPFKVVKCDTEEKLRELCEKYCVIFTATFKKLKSTTYHSIESRSKTIQLENPLMDNGRVHDADKMTVILTEVDFKNYDEFYDWESMTIHRVEVAHRGYLPRYLLDMFYEWFQKKEAIDEEKDPQGKAIVKTRVNGLFGLTVTRLVFMSVVLTPENEWDYEEVPKTYEEMIEKQVLSPFWGIYMVAHARRAELSLLFKMQNEVAYSDTDSHKLEYTDNVKTVIAEYNARIMERNKEVCDMYGYDINILQRIGCFESETSGGKKGKILRFKTQGAKRYISEYEKKGFESTISGLKKDALNKWCHDKKLHKGKVLDPFSEFNDGMTIPAEYTGKLTPIYADEPYSALISDSQGNTEIMSEKSGVYLKPTDFTMSIEKDYYKLIHYALGRMIKHAN